MDTIAELKVKDIQDLRNKYLKLLKDSKIELKDDDPRRVFMLQGIKNSAIRDLPQVESQLAEAILNNSASVFFPPKVDIETINGLAEKFKKDGHYVVQMDFDELEKKIFDALFQEKGDGPYSIDQYKVAELNRLLDGITSRLGMSNTTTIHIPAYKYSSFKSKKEAISYLEEILHENYGNILKLQYLKKEVQFRLLQKIQQNPEEQFNSMILLLIDVNLQDCEQLEIAGKNLNINKILKNMTKKTQKYKK